MIIAGPEEKKWFYAKGCYHCTLSYLIYTALFLYIPSINITNALRGVILILHCAMFPGIYVQLSNLLFFKDATVLHPYRDL